MANASDAFSAALSGGDMPDLSDDIVDVGGEGGAEPAAPAASTEPAAPAAPAPAAADPAPQPTPVGTEGDNPAFVPSGRLREEMAARRALEAQLQEMQRQLQAAQQPKEQEQLDFWNGPENFVEGAVQQATAPLQQQMRQLVEHYSLEMTKTLHGEQAINDAYAYVDQAIRAGDWQARALKERLMQSTNPYGELVQFHKQRLVAEQYADPAAARQRLETEMMETFKKDPAAFQQFMAKVSGKPVAVTQGAVAASGVTVPHIPSVAAATGGEGNEDEMSAADVFNQALANRGRR